MGNKSYSQPGFVEEPLHSLTDACIIRLAMAEIGLVGSVIALAGAGAKLCMTLYTIADGVGSAGREARIIASGVAFFSQSLTAVSKILERETSEAARLHDIAQHLIPECQ